jgi:hypothetical protein
MPETDSCPVGDTTCLFEYGSETTCKTCKTRWRKREDPHLKSRIIYEKWSCRIPNLNIPFPFVGGGIKVSPHWCRWVKVKEVQISSIDKPKHERTQEVLQKNKIYEETISILPKKFSFYIFELTRKERVKGEISSLSSVPVDVLFLDKRNFAKYEDDRNFVCKDSYEGIYDGKIDFEASSKGLWFVAIENKSKSEIRAKVKPYSEGASQPQYSH